MTDEERIARSTLSSDGLRRVGPVERARCPRHPNRWITYRWTWPSDNTLDAADLSCVTGCLQCVQEDGL